MFITHSTELFNAIFVFFNFCFFSSTKRIRKIDLNSSGQKVKAQLKENVICMNEEIIFTLHTKSIENTPANILFYERQQQQQKQGALHIESRRKTEWNASGSCQGYAF